MGLTLCSRNYSINQRMLFDENYGLASTQNLKNKDIPEGGAKGTILPAIGANPRLCFEKYVDVSVLALILLGLYADDACRVSSTFSSLARALVSRSVWSTSMASRRSCFSVRTRVQRI